MAGVQSGGAVRGEVHESADRGSARREHNGVRARRAARGQKGAEARRCIDRKGARAAGGPPFGIPCRAIICMMSARMTKLALEPMISTQHTLNPHRATASTGWSSIRSYACEHHGGIYIVSVTTTL